MLQAVYRGSAGQLPAVSPDALARQVEDLAAGVRFGLNDPEALERLREVVRNLEDVSGLEALLPRILDGALALTGADLGTIRLLDPVSGSLWLVTQSGFDSEVLDHFVVADGGDSWWLRAAQSGAQAVIADVSTDAGFAQYRDIAAAAGFRAVLSTPLADDAGHVIGAVLTHFARRHRPPAQDLQTMALYGCFAGRAIVRQLGVPAGHGPDQAISRAVISALLGPEGRPEPSQAVLFRPDSHAYRAWSQPESVTGASQLADYIMNQLFLAGLSLASARSIIGPGPAEDRVVAATEVIDGLIGYIRTAITSGLAASRGHDAPDQRPAAPGEQARRVGELLDTVASGIFEISLLLQDPADLPSGTTRLRITHALSRLEDLAQELRSRLSASSRREPRTGPNREPPPDGQLPAAKADRAVLLQVRITQTARGLQAAAADAVALLEHLRDVMQPGRIDYPTEIKRWRAFAEQAEQMVKRWEQAP